MIDDEIEEVGTFEARTFCVFEPAVKEEAENGVIIVDDCCCESCAAVFGCGVDVGAVIEKEFGEVNRLGAGYVDEWGDAVDATCFYVGAEVEKGLNQRGVRGISGSAAQWAPEFHAGREDRVRKGVCFT